MKYKIEFTPAAKSQFSKLSSRVRTSLFKIILSLSSEPRPESARPIKCKNKYLRIRKGNYRIIYTVKDDILLVLIVSIGNRRDIYKKLFR